MSSNNYDEERRTEGAASNAEDSSALSAHQQYLGDVGDGLPEGPVIDLTEPLPEGLKKEDVITFGNYYRSHSEVGKPFENSLCHFLSTYRVGLTVDS